MENTISLADAAKRLSLSWERAWRAVLSGKLQGEKREGRWRVTVRSVHLYERRRGAAIGSDPPSEVVKEPVQRRVQRGIRPRREKTGAA